MKNGIIQYYVEGADEEALVKTLTSKLRVIRPGKVQKLNVVNSDITDARLRTLAPKTTVVLIFDTDTGQREILDRNIRRLKKCPSVSEVILIPQVPNLESELIRSCDIKQITDLLNSKSVGDFKSDFKRITNLDSKLQEHHFDIHRLWTGRPPIPYQNIENQSSKIKLVK